MAGYEYMTITALSLANEKRLEVEQSTPSDLQITLHAQENISTYTKRLDFAKRNRNNTSIVNIDMTQRLLSLWQNIYGKTWNDLTAKEKNEVLDSMVSSGYYDSESS